MVLAVRIIGRDAEGKKIDHLTHTLDISANGVRVGGMNAISLKKGDVVQVQRKRRKASFKVTWLGENGTQRTGHVGLQSIDASPEFWGLELPHDGEQSVTLPSQHPAQHASTS
jgi:hypothetical protein